MLPIFLISLASFVLIILFLVWYTQFVAHKIYGKISDDLNSVAIKNSPPPGWDARLQKKLTACRTDEEKNAAVQKHIKYIENNIKNLRSFVEKTTTIPDENARGEYLQALERFEEDYMQTIKGRIEDPQ